MHGSTKWFILWQKFIILLKNKSPLAFCTVAKFENVLRTLSTDICPIFLKKSLDEEVEFVPFRLCGLKGS
jgi:hypothetical protein